MLCAPHRGELQGHGRSLTGFRGVDDSDPHRSGNLGWRQTLSPSSSWAARHPTSSPPGISTHRSRGSGKGFIQGSPSAGGGPTLSPAPQLGGIPELRASSAALPALPSSGKRQQTVRGTAEHVAQTPGRTLRADTAPRAGQHPRESWAGMERAELRAPGASCPVRGGWDTPGDPRPRAGPTESRLAASCALPASASQPLGALLAALLRPPCHFFAPSLHPLFTRLAASLHFLTTPLHPTPCTLLETPCRSRPFAAPGASGDAGQRPEGTGTGSPSPPPAPERQRPPLLPTYEQPGKPPAPDHGGRSVFLAEAAAGETRGAQRGAAPGGAAMGRLWRSGTRGGGTAASARRREAERGGAGSGAVVLLSPKPCEGGGVGWEKKKFKINHPNPARLRGGARPPGC